MGRCRSSLQGNERAAEDCLISDGFGKNGPEGMNGWVETHPYQPGPYFVAFAARLRAYPQIVAPVSRPAVLAASKLPGAGGAGLETCTTAALESGATKTHGFPTISPFGDMRFEKPGHRGTGIDLHWRFQSRV